MSAFLGPDQAATETLLATDPDVAPWVQKYQRSRETVSQTDYEVILPLPICFLRYYVELSDNHDWHLATMPIYGLHIIGRFTVPSTFFFCCVVCLWY